MEYSVSRFRRLIDNRSPVLTSFDDFASVPLTRTRPFPQNSCAIERLFISRLAFRNRSGLIGLITQIGGGMFPPPPFFRLISFGYCLVETALSFRSSAKRIGATIGR